MPAFLDTNYFEALFTNPRLREQIGFIIEVEKLKTVLRGTPLLNGSRVENDAEHSWQISMMAMVLAEHSRGPIDLLRVIRMLLIHDLVEIDAGDTFAYDDEARATQASRERTAADRIFGLLPKHQGQEFRGLWDEFEAQETDDSKFALAMDRLQPFLHSFLTGGRNWIALSLTAADIRNRTAPIGSASPVLGELTETLITDSIERGIVLHQGGD